MNNKLFKVILANTCDFHHKHFETKIKINLS